MNRKLHNDQDYPIANREYKDGLFRMVFQKKEDLLSLYNALNGSSYTDPDELEVNTLGNVLYLTRKNDISFTVIPAVLIQWFHTESNLSGRPVIPGRAVFFDKKISLFRKLPCISLKFVIINNLWFALFPLKSAHSHRDGTLRCFHIISEEAAFIHHRKKCHFCFRFLLRTLTE